MTVEIWSRDTLETTRVMGDLAAVVNAMNITAAQGKQFIIMDDAFDGKSVALEVKNITRMRELDQDDAFIG